MVKVKLYFEFLGWLIKRYTFKTFGFVDKFCEIIEDQSSAAFVLWLVITGVITILASFFCLAIDSLFPHIKLIVGGTFILSLFFYFMCIIKMLFGKFDRERGRLFEKLKK
jgi:uncharacterized membrane-anchored protein